MGLEQELQNILGLRERSRESQANANSELNALRKRIIDGETTGDRIKDFIIAHVGIFDNEESEKPYRGLEDRLKEKVGKKVLVFKQRESIHGCPGIIPPEVISPMNIGTDTSIEIGVLTGGLELDVKEGKIVFPCKKHVRKRDVYHDKKWELVEGSISLDSYVFSFYGKTVPHRRVGIPNRRVGIPGMGYHSEFNKGLLVFVDEEVERFFKLDGGWCYWETLHAHNLEVPENIQKRFDESNTIKDIYIEALMALGENVSEAYKKQYDRHVYEKRVDIINKLEGLVGNEGRLNRRIQDVYDSAKHGGFIEGGAISLVEDEDDAFWVSLGARDRLKQTRCEVKRYLGRAVELGMHVCDLQLEQKPGVVMDVAKYIKGMCMVYRVKVP